MKKLYLLYSLAVLVAGHCVTGSLHAQDPADSVCVVTISKSEDGNKFVFSAENGFVDNSPNETYVFTNCKYISFTPGDALQAKISYASEKDINFHKLNNYAVANVSSHLAFGNSQNSIIVSRIGGEYGSCKVEASGVRSRNILIRPSEVLDSLEVSVSYVIGETTEMKKDSLYVLPVTHNESISVPETAKNFTLEIRRQSLGKLETVIQGTDTVAVGDNYYDYSLKSYRKPIADGVSEVVINSFTIGKDYEVTPNSLTLSFVRTQEKKSGAFVIWLGNHWKDILLFGCLTALLVILITVALKLKNGFVKGKKKGSLNEIILDLGDKISIEEKPEMLKWKIKLLSSKGEHRKVTPKDLSAKALKVNSNVFARFVVYEKDSDFKEEYESSKFPELYLDTDKDGKINLCSHDGTTGERKVLNTPRALFESKDPDIVHVIRDNQIVAAAVGEAVVCCNADEKYSWHVIVKDKAPVIEKEDNTAPEVTPAEDPVPESPVIDRSAEMERMQRLNSFFEQIMEAVGIDPKRIMDADAREADNVISDVVKRIHKDRSMYRMVDSLLKDSYDEMNAGKVDFYKNVIEGMKEDAGYLKSIMNALDLKDPSRAQSAIDALKSDQSSYKDLKDLILETLRCNDDIQSPEDAVRKAADLVEDYGKLNNAKENVEKERDELNGRLSAVTSELAEAKEKSCSAAKVHKNNRSFYLRKIGGVLDVLDVTLQRISSNVLSNSGCADLVKSLYTSSNGFKSFMNFFNNEDWSSKDELTDIRDVIASRLEAAIDYERSWVNGVARFHAYLRVPELEAHLAASGLSKRDFEIAYNAMANLYTSFCDYKTIMLPNLFNDVYNPDIHDYNQQLIGNVISVVCSAYDSFRDKPSKLCDLNKLGYVKGDGTIVKPEVIF